MRSRKASGGGPLIKELVTEAGIAFPVGPCRRAGISFRDAEAVISSSSGDDGEGDWSLDAYRRQRDRQIAGLLPWIIENGLWIDSQILSGSRRAGMEHLILLLQDSMGTVQRVAKLTKGEAFGFLPDCDDASPMPEEWFPLRPATPAQYLQRLALVDDLIPELETFLEGFASVDGTLRIVTSQRFIDPVAASSASIQAFLIGRGFVQVNEAAWYHSGHRLALFDVRPANVLEYSGELYPVDIIPLVPGDRMTTLIQRAILRRR